MVYTHWMISMKRCFQDLFTIILQPEIHGVDQLFDTQASYYS